MRKTLVFILVWLISAACFAAFEETATDARNLGMGGAGIALPDYLSAGMENPALPCLAPVQTAGSGTSIPFGMTDLTAVSAQAGYQKEKLGLAAGFSSMGSALYRENTIKTAVSFRPFKQAGFGLGISGYNLSIQSYGSANALGLDLGLIGSPLENLTMAAVARNFNRPRIGSSDEEIAQWLDWGVSYRLLNQLTFAFQLQTQRGYNSQLRFGQEYRHNRHLALRAGFSSQPSSFSFGLGLFLKKLRLDYAVKTHSSLGLGHCLTVSCILRQTVWPEETVPAVSDPLPKKSIQSLDINTATAKELEMLPGIGAKTAEQIIAFRDSAGAFVFLDDLGNIKGISRRTLENVAPFVNLKFKPEQPAARININTADQKELEALPEVGPGTAADIIEYRSVQGLFKQTEDIMNVKGIGRKTFEKIRDLITAE
ncbi:helix-hairpin-helix domain-containing protein [candidate division TA06 bacterium]|nr:helix-hairpin-helix domain-containing protein [candidate division TA06 bacterium]